ncbi:MULTISPECIES: polysaccharide deacetylase family protein [Clostridium]|uniref:Polysaccharide deacetylase family protein n=1 Tax=Clostridium frigoriphilum TaxID=443253 RepID=A0ABU7ULZ3_9CLOT|nr:polysaccharide deacetylase family protein [Clostridium sp. DSM 17811]MBU3100091.1 polysaccharide deacetylase family protein [Clostridium sp. DSM 17811]
MNTIIKCFPNGKFKALTMSYDDGKLADKRLVKIFNKYGIKGTFHLNSGFLDSEDHVKKEEVKKLYEGHEISSHTLTHPTIARCSNEEIVKQTLGDRENLEELAGYTVRGMSYPNGSYNSNIKSMLKYLGIEYSRVVGSKDNFDLPDDFYAWQATCHHNHNLMENAEKFVPLFKKQYLYLMYVWGHSYEFDRDNNWDLIEKFCSYVSNKDDIWYATNIEIVDYMKLLDNLKFSSKGNFVYNPSFKSAWISFNDQIIEIEGGSQVELF